MIVEKFTWNAGDVVISQCVSCKNKRFDATCRAFPNGIPEAILVGQHDHTKPYAGDNGIRFEAKENQSSNVGSD